MHHIRHGNGKPLLLLHGLGGSWRSWLHPCASRLPAERERALLRSDRAERSRSTVIDALAARREVIAVDLPGFGQTPPLAGEVSIATLSDAVTRFLEERKLIGIDCVGSSMGARLALELARRDVVGATVALDPGGFWQGWERSFFHRTIGASIVLVRWLQPWLPAITGSAVGRTLLLAQLSARPWALSPEVVLTEMRSFAQSPSFDPLLRSLVRGPPQQGVARTPSPIVIGWGRRDLVCLPRQAARAMALFPSARLHWFERCGHFPQWDAPEETVRLVLKTTGDRPALASTMPMDLDRIPTLDHAYRHAREAP